MTQESKVNLPSMRDIVIARRANAINFGNYPIQGDYSAAIRRLKIVHPARLSPDERLRRFVALAAK